MTGIALGTVASFVVTRFLGSMLYDVKPSDQMTLVGVTALLLMVALAACHIHAGRATRVDPLVALRYGVGARGKWAFRVSWLSGCSMHGSASR